MSITRYGNKSVVSDVRPDDEMPYTKDGKRVDVMLNLLAIINRTTGFVPHELYITFVCNRTREQLAKMKTLKEKEKLLFDVIKELNERQHMFMYGYYKELSTQEKKDYIQSCIDDGIYIHQQPVFETKAIFYRLMDLTKKYDWLKPYDMYVKKWGTEHKIFTPYYLGEMYLIKLKQTDERGFSARSTGAINIKGLPERSYKNRTHQALTSDTAIRFGEFETLNFLIAMSPDELALFHALYRTSIKGRNDLVKSFFKDQETYKVDKSYTSRVAELFYVIFKSLGLEIEFIDEDNEIRTMSSENIAEHSYDGEIYLVSDYDFYLIKTEKDIRNKILEMNPVIEVKDLEEMVQTELSTTKRLLGSVYDESGKVVIK